MTVNERFLIVFEKMKKDFPERIAGQKEFAEFLQIPYSTVNNILKSRSQPAFDMMTTILLAIPQLNPDWFILGIGNPYRDMAEEEFVKLKLLLEEPKMEYKKKVKIEEDELSMLRRRCEVLEAQLEGKKNENILLQRMLDMSSRMTV